MDSHSHFLPPLKRFRTLQQQEDNKSLDPFSLPAKKRKESRDSSPSLSVAPLCLPTKKRIHAFQPDFELDLNLEYNPSLEDKSIQSIKPSPQVKLEVEEEDGIVCAICQSTDGDPSDPIVFCDGCDLMVHASCYGNPLVQSIPDGDWFCAQCCTDNKIAKTTFSCCLCSIEGGAMKPTTDGRWAHIVCGLFVPEVFFEDSDGREGIDCSKVPERRWKLRCYICKSLCGCCIDCSEIKCSLAFHVTCGLKEDLCIEYNQGRKSGAIVAGFCKNHTALWEKLINHGVSTSLIEKMKEETQEFFNLPMEEKKKLWQNQGEVEGFGQAFVVSEDQKLDWADLFFLSTLPVHLRKPHLFPNLPLPFRNTLDLYSKKVQDLAMAILAQMEKASGIKNEEVTELFRDGFQSMRMNYYPPCPEPEKVIGLTPHSDPVGLTILLQINEVEGLKIKKDGSWVPVTPLPNAFIVNIGDILEIITNGKYRSIEHCATVNSERERMSIAAFHTPSYDREIGPASSLISHQNHALFKRVGCEKYMKEFFTRELDGKSYLDFMRIVKN